MTDIPRRAARGGGGWGRGAVRDRVEERWWGVGGGGGGNTRALLGRSGSPLYGVPHCPRPFSAHFVTSRGSFPEPTAAYLVNLCLLPVTFLITGRIERSNEYTVMNSCRERACQQREHEGF